MYFKKIPTLKQISAVVFLAFMSILGTSLDAFAQKSITSPQCNQFTFDSTSSYDPDNEDISVFWDFGDGVQSREAVVEHTYKKSGLFTVQLTITDNGGRVCSTSSVTQKIQSTLKPIPLIKSKDIFCAKEEVDFQVQSNYGANANQLFYVWDFGDGKIVKGKQRVLKSFPKGGKYKVTVSADDQKGAVCSVGHTEKIILVNEPPQAQAGDNLLLKCISRDEDLVVSFDAANSTDINNDKLSFEWDFGDGQKGKGEKVSHKYSKIGNYEVQLEAKDGRGMSCSANVDFVTVRLNRAPKANAGKDVFVCAGEKVVFDGSKTYVRTKGTLEAKWFFGDGLTARGLKTFHVYDKPGQYQSSLSVENKLNSMCPPSKDTRVVTVNARPSVEIKAVDSSCLGNKIQFDASGASDADGDTLEYYWTFGDGQILRAGSKVDHLYKQGGEYKVTVIVDDNNKTSCSTATAVKTVRVNTPPSANAGKKEICCTNVKTNFDASGSLDPDGDKLSYLWDFGDGSSSENMATDHVYTKNGTYNVSLTVDDQSNTTCAKSTIQYTAEVNSSPVPIINIR